MTRTIRLWIRLTQDELRRLDESAGIRKRSRFIRSCIEYVLERGLTERDLRQQKPKGE